MDDETKPPIGQAEIKYSKEEILKVERIRNIQVHLKAFGLEDPSVTVRMGYQDNIPPATVAEGVNLSEACVRFQDYGDKAPSDKVHLEERWLRVYQGDQEIGSIDFEGSFDYLAAPDLKTALGWRIATELGRDRDLRYFNLDRATKDVKDVIFSHDISEETFHGPYQKVVNQIFNTGSEFRFVGLQRTATAPLWKVATRIIKGEEHQGYLPT